MKWFFLHGVRVWLAAVIMLVLVGVPLAKADYRQGLAFYNSGNYAEAFKEFLSLAQEGNRDAEQAVGLMYERGRGVAQDYRQAAHWYERAARAGHEIAAGNLGVLYRDGLGVPRDYRKAWQWLLQGAMAGEPYAMHNLGSLYANGQGTATDPVEGWAWVSLAALHDVPGAESDQTGIAGLLSPEDRRRAELRADDLRRRIENKEADSGYQAGTIPAGVHRSPPQADRQDWVSWADGGFSLHHPEGWRAAADDWGAVSVSGPEGESIVVWPVFSPDRIDGNLALKLVASLTAMLDRECRLTPARETMPGVFRAEGDPRGKVCNAMLIPVRTPRGDAATFILTRTGRQAEEALAPVFAGIMKNLVLRGTGQPAETGGSASPADMRYTSFADPTERAFTADVPAGWRAEGGVARFNASDVRPWMRLVSPDGRIRVSMGDPQIPSMLVPNAPLAGMGFTEGMVYDAGYNQRFLLRSYHPGKEAARLYAENTLAEGCGDATVVDFRDRQDLAAAINGVFRRYNSPFAEQELHAGEISRSCPDTDRAQYVFAGTLLSRIPTPQGIFAMWVMNYLFAFDAPRAEAADALAVTGRLADSLRVTPEWARMNGGLQGSVSRIVAETGTAIAKTVSDGYWLAQRTREKGLEGYGKAIRGVEEVVDPLTGRKIEIVSGANHAWIDPRGRVVGTDTDTQPGIDFRQLFPADR